MTNSIISCYNDIVNTDRITVTLQDTPTLGAYVSISNLQFLSKDQENTMEIVNGYVEFNGVPYNKWMKIGLGVGEYTIDQVSSPIGLITNDLEGSPITISGGTAFNGNPQGFLSIYDYGGRDVNFYSGNDVK